MSMSMELERKLINLLHPFIKDENFDDAKLQITIALSKYEILEKETSVIVYEGDRNELIVQRFLAAKLAAGCSARTISYYGKEARHILQAIGKQYDEVTTDDLRLYIAIRIGKDKVTKATANNERRVISSFYTWLQKEEILLKNPMAKLEPIRVKKQKKKAFAMIDIEKIRTGCRSNRERALIEVLASTWCRVSECVSIKIADIDGARIEVCGKGDKYRDVYLNARAQVAIAAYLDERSDKNPYLFPRAKYAGNLARFTRGNARKRQPEWYQDPELVSESDPMGKSSAESIVRKIGHRVGVEKVHPHRFRRTGATMALRQGMPLLTVSKLLGHESVETTQIYLDISDKELEQAHERWVT